MEKTNKLIAHFNKQQYTIGLMLSSIMIALMIASLLVLSKFGCSAQISFFNFLFVIKAFLYFAIVLFSFGLIWGITYGRYITKNKGPAVIISKRGIWVKYYNFIPWTNIEELRQYIIFGTTEGIGIRIKNIKATITTAQGVGKPGLFLAKLLRRNYHITLSNLDVSNNEILSAAKQYFNSAR